MTPERDPDRAPRWLLIVAAVATVFAVVTAVVTVREVAKRQPNECAVVECVR